MPPTAMRPSELGNPPVHRPLAHVGATSCFSAWNKLGDCGLPYYETSVPVRWEGEFLLRGSSKLSLVHDLFG